MKRLVSFLSYRYIAIGLSATMFIVFVVITAVRGGLNMGVDFVGGVKIISKFPSGTNESMIRDALKEYNPMVQQIGQEDKNEFIISTKLKKSVSSDDEAEALRRIVTEKFTGAEFLSVETVGPAIGDFLRKSAIKLFLVAIILMTVYLAFRFEFKYSVGAMTALVHDIALSVAFCGIAGVEINIPVIAALLTIFGYSVNDTIVIFDRIRENIRIESKLTFVDTINKSISQSMSRTLLTTLTTLFAVLSLYVLGGEGINDFALVLLFGLIVGTYSTIYIASPVVLGWERLISR